MSLRAMNRATAGASRAAKSHPTVTALLQSTRGQGADRRSVRSRAASQHRYGFAYRFV